MYRLLSSERHGISLSFKVIKEIKDKRDGATIDYHVWLRLVSCREYGVPLRYMYLPELLRRSGLAVKLTHCVSYLT